MHKACLTVCAGGKEKQNNRKKNLRFSAGRHESPVAHFLLHLRLHEPNKRPLDFYKHSRSLHGNSLPFLSILDGRKNEHLVLLFFLLVINSSNARF